MQNPSHSEPPHEPAPADLGDAGWVRGHVRVGQHYPLISVRYVAPNTSLSSYPSAPTSVEVARYGLALAQALVSNGHAPRSVQVEVMHAPRVSGPAADFVLYVTVELTGVDDDVLTAMARSVLVDRQALGALPPNADVTARRAGHGQPEEGPVATPPRMAKRSGRGRLPLKPPWLRVRLKAPFSWLRRWRSESQRSLSKTHGVRGLAARAGCTSAAQVCESQTAACNPTTAGGVSPAAVFGSTLAAGSSPASVAISAAADSTPGCFAGRDDT